MLPPRASPAGRLDLEDDRPSHPRAPAIAIVVGTTLACSGCLVPFAIPPLRADAGVSAPSGDAEAVASASAGVHLASLATRRDVPVDAGFGYAVTVEADYPHRVRTQGAYVDVAWLRPVGRGRGRTSLGVRASALFDDARQPGGSVVARLGYELTQPVPDLGGMDGSGGSLIAGWGRGTAAIGSYVELGGQALPGADPAWLATAGVTLRLPLILGVAVAR